MQKQALKWIITILRHHKIPFLVTGGLAAQVYGSTRTLADIDIDLTSDHLPVLLADVQPYIKEGPARYRDRQWNCYHLLLDYRGQEIDLCFTDKTTIFDARTGKWTVLVDNYHRFERHRVHGLILPILPKSDLIKHKTMLNRRVDRRDIREILDRPSGTAVTRTNK